MTTWLVRKIGSDNNGGTSKTVRSTDTDGVTAGTNTLTSVAAKFVAGDVGHGIFIGGVNQWRTVATYVNATTITFSGATIAVGSGRTWTIGGAWQTVAKSMSSATPLAAGDSVYIGAGVYRENLTAGVSGSVGNVITYIGDVDGAQTGDAGEVRITNFLTNDKSAASGTFMTLTSRTYLKFQYLHFVCGTGVMFTIPNTANNLTFQYCAMTQTSGSVVFSPTAAASTAISLTVDSCFICDRLGALSIAAPTNSTADFDVGVTVKNCVIVGGSTAAVNLVPSGALANKPGGVIVENCLGIGGTLLTASANSSTTIPCIAANNVILSAGSVALVANASGQLTDGGYNTFVHSASLTNVTVAATSSAGSMPALLHFGQEQLWGGLLRPLGFPFSDAPWIDTDAAASSPSPLTVDILGRTRPGASIIRDSGTATSGAAKTLTDTGKTWGLNAYTGKAVKIISGTGSGQIKQIASNTATVLTVDGNWQTNPDNTSVYRIYDGALATTGTATSGTTTTLTDSNAAWGTNQWAGYVLSITAGTGSGQTATITSNTATALTFAALGTAPDNTSKYSLYRTTALNTSRQTSGPYELHDRPQRESTVVDASTYAIRLSGKGTCDIRVPVDATATTISVKARFDSEHAATNKPQASILANAEIGVTAETVTSSAAQDAWGTLTFAAQTPSAKGWVTIRLAARADNADGIAYFDTVAVA